MSKVFLGVGHGGNDPGAVGYLQEKDINLAMALACRDYLEANGVEVRMSRTTDENDPLTEEINECNAYSPDLAIDIHNNAGGGDGFEVYYGIAGVGKPLAENIEAEVKAIGQNSRGLKTKLNSKGNADYYGFIRQIKCPSIIVEGVFVDNAADAAQADTAEEQKAFGVAYAKGILKTLGITPKDNVPPSQNGAQNEAPSGYLVRITANVLNVRSGPGTNYGVNTSVKKNEVYTIVGEENGWGKLKSGAGWISLQYTTRLENAPVPEPVAKTLSVGNKVKVKTNATRYATGEKIPNWIKGRVYTVKQIGTTRFPNGILLTEIMSWVDKSDLEF